MALLAQQRVAAVAGAVRLDRKLFGKVHDEAAIGIEFTRGVQAFDEVSLALDARLRGGTHAGHDAHVGDDIGAVCDLHAATRQRRIDRTHAVGNHVKRAADHTAVEQRVHLSVCVGRRHPVIVRSAVLPVGVADEGQVLHTRHVRRTGSMQITAGMRPLVQLDQLAGPQHSLYQGSIFAVRTIAPMHPLGAGQCGHVVYPLLQ